MRVLDAHPGCWLGAGSTDQHVTVDLFAAGLPVQRSSGPSTATLQSGQHVHGQLVLRATTQPVRFDSDQPLYGELLDEQGRRRNDPSGIRIGTGWGWNLLPGEHGGVAFSVSTHSARPADGPCVPAGTWALIVPIPVHAFPGNGRATTTHLVAGSFPVQLRE